MLMSSFLDMRCVMASNHSLRVMGTAFLCCGFGFLTAALLASQPIFLGSGIPFIGVGIVFLGKSRQPD